MKFNKLYGSLLIILLILLTGCSSNDLAIKVGFIYPGSTTDEGINQMQEEAAQEMVSYYNGSVQAISKSSITTANIESVIYDMINTGVQLIFISSNEFDEQVARAAQAYQSTDFVVYNGTVSANNVKNYTSREYEADYLCGMVAGLTTQSNKIGYLAPDESNESLIQINAFALGVQNTNPNAVVNLIYNGSSNLSGRIDGIVSRFVSNGCDVVASCIKDNTALLTASNAGLKVIGSSPSALESSANYLTAIKLNLSDFYIDEVGAVMNGTFNNEKYIGTIYDDFVGLDNYGSGVTEKTQGTVNESIEDIKKGNLAVFTGPMVDNHGATIFGEGQVLSEQDLLNMNYLLNNVRVLQ